MSRHDRAPRMFGSTSAIALYGTDSAAARYRAATVAPHPTNNRETWASGPQAGTDRLVIALEMGRSSVKSVITRSLSHYPNVVDGPHPRTSAALAVKTGAGHEALGPFIVYALLAPQLECPGAVAGPLRSWLRRWRVTGRPRA